MANVSFNEVAEFAKAHTMSLVDAAKVFEAQGKTLSAEDKAKIQEWAGNPGTNEDKAEFKGKPVSIELPDGFRFNVYTKGDFVLDGPVTDEKTPGMFKILKEHGYNNPRIVDGKLVLDKIDNPGVTATVEIASSTNALNSPANRKALNSFANAAAEFAGVTSGEFYNTFNGMKTKYDKMPDSQKEALQKDVNAYLEAIKTGDTEKQKELSRTILTSVGSPDGWLDPSNGQMIAAGVVIAAVVVAVAWETGALAAVGSALESAAATVGTAMASHPIATLSASAIVLASCQKDDGIGDKKEINMQTNLNINNTTNITLNQNTNIDDLISMLQTKLDEVIKILKAHSGLLASILKNQEVSQDQLKQLITLLQSNNELLKQVNNNTEEANAILTAIYEALNKLGESSANSLKAILAAIMENGGKIEDLKKLLAEINKNVVENKAVNQAILDVVSKLGLDVMAGLNAILEKIEQGNTAIKNGFNAVLLAIKNGDQKAEALLKEILEAINKNTEGDKANAEAILAAIGKLGADMSAGFTAILDAINNGDKNAAALLEKILAAINKNTESGKENAKAILAAIEKLGADMSAAFVKVLAQGDEGIALMKEILDAIKNLNIGDGSNMEVYLKAILNAINGNAADIKELLQQINGNVVKYGDKGVELGEAILAAINKLGADNQDIIKYLKLISAGVDKGNVKLDKIIELLTNLDTKADQIQVNQKAIIKGINDILAKLDDLKNGILNEIKVAIEDHEVHVTVDVTGKVVCECNCGNPNEGIITELNNILG